MPIRSGLLAIIACLLGSTAVHADDSFATAIAIQPGEISGAISSVNDVDYYKFTITSPQMVTIATKASAIGTVATTIDIHLYDAGENYLSSDGTTQSPSITRVLQSGTYFVTVESSYNSSSGPYKLVLNTQSSAIPMAKITQGNLDVPNDWKTYRFTVHSPGYVELWQLRTQVSAPLVNIDMILRDEAGTYLGQGSFGDILNPGNYFVTVNSASYAPNTGNFSLKLLTPDNATTITDGTVRGSIDVPHDQDHYRFVVPGQSPRKIRFRIFGSVILEPYLQDEFGQFLKLGRSSIDDNDFENTLNPGVYFFYLYGSPDSGVGSYGNYTLNLSGIMPAFPEISIQDPKGRDLADGKSKFSFGTSVVGSKKGITKTFVIRNTGNGTLTGIKVARLGKNAADFKIKTQPASSLAAGKQTTFKVTFKPKAKGRKSASLRITSNDADENPFDISLTGKGSKK